MLLVLIILTLFILLMVFKNNLLTKHNKVFVTKNVKHPLKILKTRLLEGEITKSEFEEIKKDLKL